MTDKESKAKLKALKTEKKVQKKHDKLIKKERRKQRRGLRNNFLKTVFKFISKSPIFLLYSLALILFSLIMIGVAIVSLIYVGFITFLFFAIVLVLMLCGWLYAFNFYLKGEERA